MSELMPYTPTILEQAFQATKQTEQSHACQLLKTLTNHALEGTVVWNKSVINSLNEGIRLIDEKISTQLAEVLHQAAFQKLEGSWRGLHYLTSQLSTGQDLKIRVFNATKKEIQKDLNQAIEFDQSQLFKKIYESEFGMPGGEPYGVMIGDYEFGNHPEDVSMLQQLSGVAAAAFCPFISAASANLFGFDEWPELANPRDLAKIFDSSEYIKWNQFRESEDARFVTLTLPRTLARLPYGELTAPVSSFQFEEFSNKAPSHQDYCWMNAAYALITKIGTAQSHYGWATAIRGAEGGGQVKDLPLHIFRSDDGDMDALCPTEIGITDRREAELSRLGFLPLCHYKGTDYAVFFGAQSLQKIKKHDRPEATANAEISARLPYLLATSRFAHYLKVMARDKIGSFMERQEIEDWMNRWINQYVNANGSSKQELKAKYPLANARIEVKEIPGNPGAYNAIAWLRPWLQMEELTTSLRLVARIPKLE
jgi:type VI secretion system protein ImpC